MNVNLTATPVLTEEDARAAYTAALTKFDAQARTCEALASELEEEQALLGDLKTTLEAAQLAFIQSVERKVFEPKTEAEDKADREESRGASGLISDATKMAYRNGKAVAGVAAETERREGAAILAKVLPGSKPHSCDSMPPAPVPITEVSEGDRDETVMAVTDTACRTDAELSPGAERAANISTLSEEKEAVAKDVLDTVNAMLKD